MKKGKFSMQRPYLVPFIFFEVRLPYLMSFILFEVSKFMFSCYWAVAGLLMHHDAGLLMHQGY